MTTTTLTTTMTPHGARLMTHARPSSSSAKTSAKTTTMCALDKRRHRSRGTLAVSAVSSASSSSGAGGDVAGNPYEQTSSAANERQALFNDIAPVYDRLNDQLSLGLHRAWKRCAVKWCGATIGARALDVCCGSGDVAIKLSDAVGATGAVVGLDFAANQLKYAGEKEASRRAELGEYAESRMAPIEWIEGDALALPFEDDSFDCATIAYGLRNVSDIPLALRELRRVVRPGAKVAVLDFNNPTDATTASVQGFVLDNIVVPFADLNGVAAEYRYLRPSIERFPRGQEQVDLARDAGFSQAEFYELQPGGLMGCLVATK